MSYQTSVGFYYSASGENNPSYGTTCYNNGIEQRYFSLDEDIPEGFVLGVKEESRRKQSEAQKGKKPTNSIKVITSPCCYFSVKDAMKELGVSST